MIEATEYAELLNNRTITFSKRKLNKPKTIETYPIQDPFEELNQVGYWCLIGALPREFSEFVGQSDRFDFYYLYKNFDYSKFDPSWLLRLSTQALKAISRNETVRKQIRIKVADILINRKIEPHDEECLKQILTKYFC